jgi:hypothetical protein
MKTQLISEKLSEHLEGQIFGKLTVIERDKTKPTGRDAYWICKCECGNTCSIRSTDLTKGKTKSCGCINSKGELKLKELLTSLNINYISQYKFDDLWGEKDKLRFDFFLPDENILIEYQGIQHYKPQEHFGGQEEYNRRIEYDNLKREYCKKNNYKLIEIPYYDYDKLNQEYILKLLKEN